MPELRNLWPEYRDDDRWWIHPLEDRVDPMAGSPLKPSSVPEVLA